MHLRPLQLADVATYADWGADRELCLHAGWTVGLDRFAREAHWLRVIEEGRVLRLAAVRGDEVVGYVDLAGTTANHRELGYVVGPSSRWVKGSVRRSLGWGWLMALVCSDWSGSTLRRLRLTRRRSGSCSG